MNQPFDRYDALLITIGTGLIIAAITLINLNHGIAGGIALIIGILLAGLPIVGRAFT